MDGNRSVGRVTSSTGDVDPDGALVGSYRGTGTMIDPGRTIERAGLDDRIRQATTAATPDLATEQLAGVRRMLGLAVTR